MAIKLGPGEQVIFQGHPSWRAILGFYVQWLLASAVVTAGAAAVTALFGDGVDEVLAGAILVAGVALTILGGFLKRMTTTYTITNRRLNIRRGLVSRQIQETRLERVQNVSYSQSVYQRVMQIGDVDFDTASDDEYGFIFTGVAQPEDVVHRVGQATEAGGGEGGLGDEGEADRSTG